MFDKKISKNAEHLTKRLHCNIGRNPERLLFIGVFLGLTRYKLNILNLYSVNPSNSSYIQRYTINTLITISFYNWFYINAFRLYFSIIGGIFSSSTHINRK